MDISSVNNMQYFVNVLKVHAFTCIEVPLRKKPIKTTLNTIENSLFDIKNACS